MRNISNTITLSAASRGRGGIFLKLAKIPGIQIIYVSALACTRHRGVEFVELQRRGLLSYLMLDAIDMITGDYIDKTKAAAAEIAAERSPTGIILMTGCQSALLSTDYGLLTQEIEAELGIPVRVHDGCRLCGFDEDAPAEGTSSLNQLLYEFIPRAERSAELCVNILGESRLDESGELAEILRDAGVRRINRLEEGMSLDEYRELGRAHLNIITAAADRPIGELLKTKLGIPWVCLGGSYSPSELEQAYETLARALGTRVRVSGLKRELEDRLASVKRSVGKRPIAVGGDVELAKWLITEGFAVQSLRLNPHQGLSKEQRSWFKENAPAFIIEEAKRPSGTSGGEPRLRPHTSGGESRLRAQDGGFGRKRHGGTSGEEARHRPQDGGFGRGGNGRGRGGRGGGRDHGGESLKLGFAGCMAVLDSLEGGTR